MTEIKYAVLDIEQAANSNRQHGLQQHLRVGLGYSRSLGSIHALLRQEGVSVKEKRKYVEPSEVSAGPEHPPRYCLKRGSQHLTIFTY